LPQVKSGLAEQKEYRMKKQNKAIHNKRYKERQAADIFKGFALTKTFAKLIEN